MPFTNAEYDSMCSDCQEKVDEYLDVPLYEFTTEFKLAIRCLPVCSVPLPKLILHGFMKLRFGVYKWCCKLVTLKPRKSVVPRETEIGLVNNTERGNV